MRFSRDEVEEKRLHVHAMWATREAFAGTRSSHPPEPRQETGWAQLTVAGRKSVKPISRPSVSKNSFWAVVHGLVANPSQSPSHASWRPSGLMPVAGIAGCAMLIDTQSRCKRQGVGKNVRETAATALFQKSETGRNELASRIVGGHP